MKDFYRNNEDSSAEIFEVIKRDIWLDAAAHTCSPGYLEVEIGGSWFEGNTIKMLVKPSLKE
jgi:hypothetical protein